MTPANIRQIMRAKRMQLSPQQQQHASQQACAKILHHPRFQQAQLIGSYLATQGEQNPAPLWPLAPQKHWFLPIVQETPCRQLQFAPYQPGDTLTPNIYRIPEPVVPKEYWVSVQQLDCLIVPLVAFDAQGYRLGMGGGYYDRTLAYLQQYPTAKPYRIGLGYAFQYIEKLPHQPWDIPLQTIITENSELNLPSHD